MCAVTSGPSATNVITGIATAFADSIPLVCITGQVNSSLLGSDVFQEADITGAVESFVKYSYLVKDANDIPRIFKEAFHIANTGRKGPVLIDIPIDIQNAQIKKFEYPEEVNMRTYKPTVKGNMVQIKKVIRELERSNKPIICVGGGVILSEAEKEVIAFAEKYQIPVYAHEMEQETLENPSLNLCGMVGEHHIYHADEYVKDEQVIELAGFSIQVMHTPGHTVGGVCYYIPEQNILFSGDTLFQESVGRTDFPKGSASDLVRSIREKLMPLPDDVEVYTGHGESTLIGYERIHNPFL